MEKAKAAAIVEAATGGVGDEDEFDNPGGENETGDPDGDKRL